MGNMTIELGSRASRGLLMENLGSAKRRMWWIVSSAVLATCEGGVSQRAA